MIYCDTCVNGYKVGCQLCIGCKETVSPKNYKSIKSLEIENAELQKQLEEVQNLSEQRRLALLQCDPSPTSTLNGDVCIFCGVIPFGTHKQNCDWLKLTKG